MVDPQEVGAAVGQAVRRLRQARAWSFDALAQRSGVGKGVLVGLEQDGGNPSLTNLCRLAEAFAVPLTALVEPDAGPTVRVVDGARATRLWAGGHGGSGDLLLSTDPPSPVELWHWSLQPGDERRSEAHAAGTREAVLVTSGTLVLDVGGQEHRLAPGSAATFAGDRPHRYRADAAPTAFVLVVTVPPAA